MRFNFQQLTKVPLGKVLLSTSILYSGVTFATPTSVAYSHDGKSVAVGFPYSAGQRSVGVKVYDRSTKVVTGIGDFDTRQNNNTYNKPDGGVIAVRFSKDDLSIYTHRTSPVTPANPGSSGQFNSLCRFDLSTNSDNLARPACMLRQHQLLFDYDDNNADLIDVVYDLEFDAPHYVRSRIHDEKTLVVKANGQIAFGQYGPEHDMLAVKSHPRQNLTAYVAGYYEGQFLKIYERKKVNQVEQQIEVASFQINTYPAPTYNNPEENLIYNISWSADGSLVAAGYKGGVVKVWNWKTASLVKTITTTYSSYVNPLYTQDGQHLLIGDQVTGSVSVYDAASFQLKTSLTHNCGNAEYDNRYGYYGNGLSPQRFAVSPDSQKVAITCGSDYVEADIGSVTGNLPPVVKIASPIEGQKFNPGSLITFIAMASDPEDGDVSSSIKWSSNLQGQLGNKPVIDVALTTSGTHQIVAMAVDSKSAQGSERITVKINHKPQINDLSWQQSGVRSYLFNIDIADLDGLVTTTTTLDFGDGNQLELNNSVASPQAISHQYAAAGQYQVTLTITDEMGLSSTLTKMIDVVDGEPQPEPGVIEVEMGKVSRDLWGEEGSETFYKVFLGTISKSMKVKTKGGSGDVDLYVRKGKRPTLTDFDCNRESAGNNETCIIKNATPGYYYIMLRAYDDYEDVSLRVSRKR